MRKLFEINGNLYRTIQQPEGVDKRFEFVGTIMDVDKVMQVIDSVMVIPPAVQELIKDKLKEL